MNLGAENKNKVIAAAVLGALAAIILVWQLWPSSTTSASVPVAPAAQTVPGKKGAQPLSTIDPTLRTDLLKDSEGTKYEGNGKNIFVAGMEQIEQPLGNGTIGHQPTPPPPPPQAYTPPPPPPIPLRFYGFASQNGGQKKIFLAKDEDIFIAAEGDIVDRRYKVIHIFPMAVEIEDVLNNNRQQIPLTQS